jgi:hypothetical protein
MRVEQDLVGAPAGPGERVLVDVVVPVYNEAAGLEFSVRRLHAYLGERFPFAGGSPWPRRPGLRMVELLVDWVDDPDSRVDVVRTALDDLRGVARLSVR